MITILTGAPGHGKSYTMVREIERAISKNKPVVTNVPLRSDWATVMARRHVAFHWFKKERVERKAKEYERHLITSDDFDELLKVRIDGEGEGRAMMVLDESQRWLNVRGTTSELDDEGKPVKMAIARNKRQKVVNHLSGHRHYGYDIILATQAGSSLDTQARNLYEFHAEVRNMKRLPWLKIFIRFNLFMKVTRWNDRQKTKAGVECYWLNKGIANLYHTHSLQEYDWPDDVIILPRPHDIDNPTDVCDNGQLIAQTTVDNGDEII